MTVNVQIVETGEFQLFEDQNGMCGPEGAVGPDLLWIITIGVRFH